VSSTDSLNYPFEDAHASFRPAENTAAVAHHRVIIQMAENALISGIFESDILRFHREGAPPMPVLDHFAAGLLVAFTDVNRIHRKDFPLFNRMSGGAERAPVHLYAHPLLLVRRNPR